MKYFRELDRLAEKLQKRIRWYNIFIKGDEKLFPKEHRRDKQIAINYYGFLFLIILVLSLILFDVIKNMNVTLDIKVSIGIILVASVLAILSILLKRFMMKIVGLYPPGYNEKIYEVTEHIAHIEIESWITNKRITKEQIELQLLPYLDRVINEKNKFSLKTLIHLVLTSSILTVPIFLTNLMLAIFNNTSINYGETIHLFYLIVIAFFVTLITGFVITNIFFSFFSPPYSERTYLIIQRLFWQEITNKKSSILKVEDYRIPFFLSNKRDLFR